MENRSEKPDFLHLFAWPFSFFFIFFVGLLSFFFLRPFFCFFLPNADVIIFNERLQNYTWNTSRRRVKKCLYMGRSVSGRHKGGIKRKMSPQFIWRQKKKERGKKGQNSEWKMWKITTKITATPEAIKSFNLKSKYCNIINPMTSLKRERRKLFWFQVKKIVHTCASVCVCGGTNLRLVF